jgi:hypothetical protein
MEIQQNRYENMQPIPAPEPYTLPHTLRITYSTFIFWSLILLPILAYPLLYLVTTNILDDLAIWILCLLTAAFSLLMYLGAITWEIRLTEDRISYREWFSSKEMEYSRITAVRYYYWNNAWSGTDHPKLELTGDSGTTITINLDMFDSVANRRIIHDVLKEKAGRAGINRFVEDFYAAPNAIPWRMNLQPEPYTLPLTLPKDKGGFRIILIIFLLIIIPGSLIFTVFPGPVGWVCCFLLIACYWLGYYLVIRDGWEVGLTEDRISYRDRSSRKEMEYTRITAVRYYRRNTDSSYVGLEQILELSGDNGDTITIRFGPNPDPENIGIIYDVLKKKAHQAGLRNSPGVFFAHPEAIVSS